MNFPGVVLKFWKGMGNLLAYASFLNSWFEYVKGLLLFPTKQFDAETANIFIVDLLAWERDIERFNAEPEWLYRKRVKYAYANARDAGTAAGFKRIWERMELGHLEINERIDGRDWDIVSLEVTESVISDRPELLDIIIEKYGRTCRRHEWYTKASITMNVLAVDIDHSTECVIANSTVIEDSSGQSQGGSDGDSNDGR